MNVQAPPPPIQQPINQEEPKTQQIIDYITYMNTSMNDQISFLYSHLNIPPYHVQPYESPHYQAHEDQDNMNQAHETIIIFHIVSLYISFSSFLSCQKGEKSVCVYVCVACVLSLS